MSDLYVKQVSNFFDVSDLIIYSVIVIIMYLTGSSAAVIPTSPFFISNKFFCLYLLA